MARVDRIRRVSLCISLLAAVATHSATLSAAPADVARTLTIAPKIMEVSPSAVRAVVALVKKLVAKRPP